MAGPETDEDDGRCLSGFGDLPAAEAEAKVEDEGVLGENVEDTRFAKLEVEKRVLDAGPFARLSVFKVRPGPEVDAEATPAVDCERALFRGLESLLVAAEVSVDVRG